MAKIIRDNSRVSKYNIEEFAHVERGEKLYHIKSFSSDEERSIQDSYDDIEPTLPNTISTVDEDDINDDMYLPPSKLAKASDNIKVDKVEFSNLLNDNDVFTESPLFSDEKADEDEYPKKVISSAEQPQDTPVQSEANAQSRVKVLEDILIQKEEDFKKAKEELELDYNQKLEEAKVSSYNDGYSKAKSEVNIEFEAKRDDYIKSVERFSEEALKKIADIDTTLQNMDEDIPKIVLGYVKSIIGTERELNDEFIYNLIKTNMKRLEDFKIIEFKVNPDDVELIKSKFPNYQVTQDTNLIKGAVTVITQSGVISLDVDNMINDFGKSLNEKSRVS